MTTLNDKAIRAAIKSMLWAQVNKPLRIVDELHVHNGNAIIDIAAVYKTIHGIEIKGETDKVSRAFEQARYYELAIPRLTLITTANHIEWATRNLESHWGIILASRTKKQNIQLRHVRPASTNKKLSKEIALLTLWKPELIDIANEIGSISTKRKTRSELAKSIACTLSKGATLEVIAGKLAIRSHSILC